jgi:hypothetical protein
MTTQETLLIALRGRLGDSQTAIAEATGLSLSRLNNYVRGERRMDDDAVIACCEVLGWNTNRYVSAHRAEMARTEREAAFWKRLARTAAATAVFLATSPITWGMPIMLSTQRLARFLRKFDPLPEGLEA